MAGSLFSINGGIVPEAQAVVPVTNRGFLYGDGLFETLHAYGAKLFRLDEHLRRLAAGAERLGFNPPLKLTRLAAWVREATTAASFAEANVRLVVTRGDGPPGPSPLGHFEPWVLVTVGQHARPAAERFTQGVAAIIASFRRQEAAATATLKTLNYLEQILARREADLAGADEALLLNNAGLLCEGSASNISIIRGGTLLIPDPLRCGALPGVAQATAIEAALNLQLPVRHASLSTWDLYEADEAFLSGSMRELTPLVKVGERAVGPGRPGPLTARILAEYRRIVERECRPFEFPK